MSWPEVGTDASDQAAAAVQDDAGDAEAPFNDEYTHDEMRGDSTGADADEAQEDTCEV